MVDLTDRLTQEKTVRIFKEERIMKKFLTIFSILAATVLSFSSCQKEVIEETSQVESLGYHTLTFTAGIGADTKTTFNDGKTAAIWCEEDKANFDVLEHYTENGAAKSHKANNQTVTLSDGNQVASITATFENLPEGCVITGYQSIVAANKDTNGNPMVAAVQTPEADAYDKNADVLISQMLPAGADKNDLKFNFKRVVCINKMTLKGLTAGDKISQVTFTSTTQLAPKFDIANNNTTIAGANSIVCNFKNVQPDASGNLVVYFLSGTGEFAAPKVSVISDKALYEKTFTKNITFGANDLYSFGVSGMIRTAGTRYDLVESNAGVEAYGRYVIACENTVSATSPLEFANLLGKYVSGNNIPGALAKAKFNDAKSILVDESVVTPFTLIGSNGAWQFMTDDYPAQYLRRSQKSNSNDLSIGTDDLATWSIDITNSSYANIVNTGVEGFSIKWNTSGFFSTYTTGQNAVALYRKYTGDTPEPPVKDKYTITINSSIVNGSVSASLTQAEAGTQITLTATPDEGYKFDAWDVKDAANNKVTVTNNQFTMPAANVTVSATFREVSAGYSLPFYESFNTNDGTGGNDNQWSGNIASNNLSYDNEGWTVANGKGAKQCAKFGTTSAQGTAQTPVLLFEGNATLTFKAAAWNGDDKNLYLSTTSGELSVASVTMKNNEWSTFEVIIVGAKNPRITFSGKNRNRFFLDEVRVVEGGDAPVVTKYAVNCATVEGGTLSADPAEATEGATVTLTATPAEGYEFGSWNVTNASTSAAITVTDNKFTMPAANVNVSATFTKQSGTTYTVMLNNALYGIGTGNNGTEQSATTSDGFTVVSGCKTNATTKTYYDSGHIRYYADSYLNVSAPSGSIITKIEFVSAGTWNDSGILSDGGSYENKVWTGEEQSVTFSFSAQCRASSIKVTIESGSEPVKYNVNCQTVTSGTISATPTSAAAGATITLTATPATGYELEAWNVTNASTSASIEVVNNKFTMPAANVNVSATFKEKEMESLKTMDEIFAAATAAGSTATDTKVTFNNWVVSGVKDNNAYVTDGTKGFVIYGSGHGFVVGDKLSGTVNCKVQLFRGAAELTSLTKANTGLTVSNDGVITPQTIAITGLSGVNTGAVITFEELTYNGSAFTDGTNTITPYNTFITLPTLVSGKKYSVTGVYIQYNTTREIAPRTSGDIVEKVAPKYAVNVASGIVNGTVTVDCSEATEGQTVTITATPASGYKLKSVSAKKTASGTAITVTNNKTFTMPAEAVTVSAEFESEGTGSWTPATMAAGTNGSPATVNEKSAIKVGTSSKGGDMTINVASGATRVRFYAAAWNGVTGLSLNITPATNVNTTSVNLTADTGVSGNSPFTLAGTESTYLFEIDLKNVTADTTLKLTSSTTKRFVVWGAEYFK